MGVDKDQARADTLTFEMLNPTSYKSYGELKDVILSKSSLTAGYYTDARTSGKITVQGNGWRRGSFVRITHTAPGWKNVIGTYIVAGDDSDRHHGVWEQELELHSMLYALSTDRLTSPYVVAKGGMSLAAIKRLLASRGRPAVYSRPGDHRHGAATVYETGETVLSTLFDLCERSGNRLDVDGLGRVTVGRYVRPAQKTPKLVVDLSDPRGVAHDDLRLGTNWLSMATNAVVSYKYHDGRNVEREIRATATVNAKSHAARGVRGYNVTLFESLAEMSPATQATADQRVQRLLAGNSAELVEWELTTQYLPVWEGDVITLSVHDGRYRGNRKCLVKNVDLGLATMKMKLGLKETASGDDGE